MNTDEHTNTFRYSEDDFPVLGECSKRRKNPKSSSENDEKLKFFETNKDSLISRGKKLKLKKYQDTFAIDLRKALKASNVSSKANQPKRKNRCRSSLQKAFTLSGNPLDSSNPPRHKGKLRLKLKCKSRMKRRILASREERSSLRHSLNGKVSIRNDGIYVYSEVVIGSWKDIYITHPILFRQYIRDSRKCKNEEFSADEPRSVTNDMAELTADDGTMENVKDASGDSSVTTDVTELAVEDETKNTKNASAESNPVAADMAELTVNDGTKEYEDVLIESVTTDLAELNVGDGTKEREKNAFDESKATTANLTMLTAGTEENAKDGLGELISDCAVEDGSGYKSLKRVTLPIDMPDFKLQFHSSNFKTYCDNVVTAELKIAVQELVTHLVRFQHNKYQVNPTKAIADKRYVIGFRQVKKYLIMNKINFIIFACDVEDAAYETIEEIKSLATAYSIPYVCCYPRRKLGYFTFVKIVSCVGIMNYSSAEKTFNLLLEHSKEAKKAYKSLTECQDAKCSKHLHEMKSDISKQLDELSLE